VSGQINQDWNKKYLALATGCYLCFRSGNFPGHRGWEEGIFSEEK
jgi:hypothetical protein